MSVEDRVARGVEILDREEPGWVNHLNTDTLDISSLENCVLGQLYGSYGEGREALGIPLFCEDVYGFDGYSSGDVRSLTHEWLRVIESRRSA